MAKLALDHVQGHPFARHLHSVGMAQLMRSKAPPHPGIGRETPQLRSRR